MQHLKTCLLKAEADRVLCHLFALDVQNEIQLLSTLFSCSWLACLSGFWLRNATLHKSKLKLNRKSSFSKRKLKLVNLLSLTALDA